MKKVGLVLEGGAMRGLYTAGVLDTFMNYNIEVDGIVGVSAGALFGVNYFSNQKERAIRYNKKYCKDKRYISINSLLKTGNIINKEFAFYEITNNLDKFNDEVFKKNNKDFYVVLTNVLTGKSEYINIKNSVIENIEVLRGTSAMPFVSKMVEIDENKYLDGALSDSIPINYFLNLGYEKLIIVLTRDIDYNKKGLNIIGKLLTRIKYHKYPELIKAINNRHEEYNEKLEYIKKLEQEGKVFVIRPSKRLTIKRLEKNIEKLEDTYNLGINDTLKIINKLKEYIDC